MASEGDDRKGAGEKPQRVKLPRNLDLTLSIDVARAGECLEVFRQVIREVVREELAVHGSKLHAARGDDEERRSKVTRTGVEMPAGEPLKARDVRTALLLGKIPEDAGLLIDEETTAEFHGMIDEADPDSIGILPSDGSERRRVPTDLKAIRPAPGGSYRLASTGQVVTGPMLLTSWMFTEGSDDQGHPCYVVRPNHAPLLQSRVPTEWELTYEWDERRIRRTIDLFGDEYVGRTLLLCLNYVGPDGGLIRQEQHVGTIMVVDLGEGIVVSCEPDGRMFVLPGDPSRIERSPPAKYRLRSTGQVVRCPDYLAKFTTGTHD